MHVFLCHEHHALAGLIGIVCFSKEHLKWTITSKLLTAVMVLHYCESGLLCFVVGLSTLKNSCFFEEAVFPVVI